METKTSEATQVSDPVTEYLYCINCEKMVMVERDRHGIYHSEIIGWDFGINVCAFPLGFTFCPPPVTDEPTAEQLEDWAAQDRPEAEIDEAELNTVLDWLGE